MVYRVGIVGTGENARDHGRACQRVAETELVAVCDISSQALTRFGEEFEVNRRYERLDKMLEEEQLDIVVVSTWGVSHAEIAQAIACSGKVQAILVEKPISITASECTAMIAAAREHGVLLAEGYKFRFHPQFSKVKEIVDSGRIGQLAIIQCTLSSPLVRYVPRANWRYHRDRGGGSVFDTASYLVHFARFVTGAEPEWVFATGSYADYTDVELSAAITMRFPDNVTVQLISSYEHGYCQSTMILGSRGWVRMDLPFDQRSVREVEFAEKEELPARVYAFCDNFDSEVYEFAPVNQFTLQLKCLCECLEHRKAHPIPMEFSLGNMRAIDAIYSSMRMGAPVSLQDVP